MNPSGDGEKIINYQINYLTSLAFFSCSPITFTFIFLVTHHLVIPSRKNPQVLTRQPFLAQHCALPEVTDTVG